MPEVTDEKSIKAILSRALAKLNIKNYNLHLNDCTVRSEGYAGEIWRAKVVHENGEEQMVVKSAVKDENHRSFVKAEVLYRNEVCFYSTIFPAMDKLQKEKQVTNPFKAAKCYATSIKEKEESLVLEDLKAAGFDMCNKMEPLDEGHITLVLTQYGKLHALSFALRDQRPEIFKEVTAGLVDAFPLVLPSFMDGFMAQIYKNAEMLKQEGHRVESELAKKVAAELEEILYAPLEPDDEPYAVVAHGDCWCCNMMFKYEEKTRRPIDHRFLDFQISRVHSPAFDLSYFFYTSAPKHVMDEVEKYLQIYYTSLSDTLKQLGSDPEKVFPFSVLQKHWTKFRRFGLAMSLFIFRFILSQENETPSLTRDAYVEDFVNDIANQKQANRRVTDVLKHFVEDGGVW